MKMVDFHAHLLPGIDDGSRDRDMTAKMLQSASEQGIDVIVATPHFYPDRMMPARFLEDRDRAFEQIAGLAAEYGITVLPGAEVTFFSGIGRADRLHRLCIADTRLLLLEMPFRRWHAGDLQEVDALLQRGYRVVLAHLERFVPLQTDRRMITDLLQMPALIQVNADSLTRFSTRRTALRLLRRGGAVLGSDCHDLTTRPQNLLAGRRVIEKRLGGDYLQQMDRLSQQLLRNEAKLPH